MIGEIEAIRGRPLLCHAANVVRSGAVETAIAASDHLPFSEMVGQVDASIKDVDILLATPGGSADQVNLFVEALRPRFETVEFLIPCKAMSAGTLWALSGDRIWMDERAFLGPLDPQGHSKDGNLVPAQALLTLVATIQEESAKALASKQHPPWALIRLLDKMDHKQLGAALSSSQYVTTLAAQYLEQYYYTLDKSHVVKLMVSSGLLILPNAASCNVGEAPMIDPKTLRDLGWSEELIEAAREIASSIPDPVSAPSDVDDVRFDFGETVTSDEFDLPASPPVAETELLVGP